MRLWESILDGLAELRAHRLRTILQTLGIVLGVASLVAVQGLVDAGRRRSAEFLERIGAQTRIAVYNDRDSGARPSARRRASHGLTMEDVRAIREEIPTVLFADTGNVGFHATVRSGRREERGWIGGATPDFLAASRMALARGRFITDADVRATARICVLGDRDARIHFGTADPIGQVLYIEGVGFTVAGVLARQEFYDRGSNSNALEWMNRFNVIPVSTMSAVFFGGRRASVVAMDIVVDRPASVHPAARAIEALLVRRHGGVKDFRVSHRGRWSRPQGEQRRVFDLTFLATGAVSLLVGGIVVMNIMLASLQERVREVGLRKACGARASDIAVQFLVESILVSAVGGGAGLALGILFTRLIGSLLERMALITTGMALVSLLVSISVGLLFGLAPAVKASRLNPVEALRYE
jgi:putative ABC transport system permease protein